MNALLPPLPDRGTFSRCKRIEIGFNRARLATVPRLASVLIIIGIVSSILGSLGLLTALSGVKIHGLEFIAKQIPTSVALSLVMMRAGLHSINNGVSKSTAVARWRQEGMMYYMMAALEPNEEEKAVLLRKAAEFHWSLPAEYGLNVALSKEALYGKRIDDPQPLAYQPSRWEKSWDDCWASFYNFWASKQKTIGKLDVGVGALMGIAGVTSLIFLTMGPSSIPNAINILAKDPYLSLSFTFLLFAYGIDSVKRGNRMKKLEHREMRRANVERHLQEIVQRQGVAVPAAELNLREVRKGLPSRLGKVAIVVGIIITALGLLYLGLSVSNHLPARLDVLTQNTPLSVLYATTLLTTGFFTYYSGVSMLDKREKARWRHMTVQRRNALFNFFNHRLPADFQPDPAIVPEKKFRVTALDGIMALGYGLGAFLIISGVIGLFVAGGYHVHSSLSFISADPSFSSFFCASMILFGIDALCNADRMRTYFDRRIEDFKQMDLLGRYLQHLRHPPPALPPPV